MGFYKGLACEFGAVRKGWVRDPLEIQACKAAGFAVI